MIKKQSLFLSLLLIIACASLFFFLSNNNTVTSNRQHVPRNFLQHLQAANGLRNDTIKNIFRLYSKQDSLILIAENVYFITNADLSYTRKLDIKDAQTLYFLQQIGDSMVYLDVDRKMMSISTPFNTLKRKIDSGILYSGAFNNGLFYFDLLKNEFETSGDELSSSKTEITINV
ncbi:MAG: hypothetical protein C4308_06445 [Chitinophagaceae bacterium]